MQPTAQTAIKDGDACVVNAEMHAGKVGTVRDVSTSRTGVVMITVVQSSGERFKALAKNVTPRSAAKKPSRL